MMSSTNNENDEASSSNLISNNDVIDGSVENTSSQGNRPPAKRRLSSTVIEISDTESDDSDVCAVNSYQASADEVKRIRGAEYSSSSSSSDYSSDSESPWEDDSIVLEDEKGQCKIPRAQLNSRANRIDDPIIAPRLKSEELMDKLTTHWRELTDYSSEEVTLTCEPFRLCLLHDFLQNSEIINNIVDDMNTLDWSRKKMDLYEFHQTTDLASLTWQRSIRGIYELLKNEVMTWVSQVTGVHLTTVSASCSLYGPGDHLLVHDDLMADRRIAFIFYLAPWNHPLSTITSKPTPLENGNGDNHVVQVDLESKGWASHMGGALELLASDSNGCPTTVTHRVFPRNNMLAFFRVGAESFHQVSEVLSLELPRLSINGWFHGPATQTEPPAESSPPPPHQAAPHRPHSEPVLMNQWLETSYMSPRCRGQIQTQMERESEVCLRDFFVAARRDLLLEALCSPDVVWEACGPANQRHYEQVSPDWVETLEREHPIHVVLKLVSGTTFFRFLADCTDLVLTAFERLELQRWSPGNFTVLPPREQYQQPRLELVMYLGVPQRPICGGTTTFVAPEEGAPADGGALVTVPPQDNALNLVYCDIGAAGFTKYLSKMTMSQGDHFYILTCTYRE